jgi:aerobic C4-dicarboxylate transport protein
VDWLIGILRAVSNLIGNCVATLVIGVWENDVDKKRVHQMLDGPNWAKSELGS